MRPNPNEMSIFSDFTVPKWKSLPPAVPNASQTKIIKSQTSARPKKGDYLGLVVLWPKSRKNAGPSDWWMRIIFCGPIG